MAGILVIESDPLFLSLTCKILERHKHQVWPAGATVAGMQLVNELKPEIVLCTYHLKGQPAAETLLAIKKISSTTQVIFIAADFQFKDAVNLLRLGAANFMAKPLTPHEILTTVEDALSLKANERQQANKLAANPVSDNNYWFSNSVYSQNLKKQIELVAPTNFSVVIHGENGTGKEGVAKMIHQCSKRNNKPFVAIDCGTLSRELAASELFGHERGSFTGADRERTGKIETAQGGTLFLDEIANLNNEVQQLLLRALQERKIRRVGGNSEINIDMRIIVASNARLAHAVEQGSFRGDLYHRLNEFSIDIPPLRERREDITYFAAKFIAEIAGELNRPVPVLTDNALGQLINYYWPGNLRELKNCLRRAVLVNRGPAIDDCLLPGPVKADMGLDKTMDAGAENKSEPKPTPRKKKVNLRISAFEAQYEKLFNSVRK